MTFSFRLHALLSVGILGLSALARPDRIAVASVPSARDSEKAKPVLWLKSETLASLKDGDPISRWEDSSGKGAPAVQNNSAQMPKLKANAIGSFSGAYFDGQYSRMQLPPGSVFTKVTDFTAYFVFRPEVLASRWQTLFGGGYGGDNPTLGFSGAMMGVYNSPFSPTSLTATTPLVPGTWYLLEYIKEVSELAFLANGATVGQLKLTIPSSTITSSFRGIGCGDTDSECIQGHLLEMIIYDTAISDEQRTEVSCSLAQKYRLAISGC